MTWRDAKAALARELDGLTAEIPARDGVSVDTSTIAKVYTEPPESIEISNLPCVMFEESTLEDVWGAGYATEAYVLSASVMFREEQIQRAIEWAEAFREGVKNRLRRPSAIVLRDQDGTLVGQVSSGVSVTSLGTITRSGMSLAGFRFNVELSLQSALPSN